MSEIPTAATFSSPPPMPPALQPPPRRPPLGPGHFKLGRALTILLACSIGAAALGVLLDAYGIGVSTLRADPWRRASA